MNGTLGIFLIIYALALWVALIFVWRKGYREWKANRATRIRKFLARVMDKRSGDLVLFEYQGRQREFKVDRDTHQALRVGQDGSLFLKGDEFEAFEPKSDIDRADETYRRMVKD